MPGIPARNVFSAMFPFRANIESGCEEKPCFPPFLTLWSSRPHGFASKTALFFHRQKHESATVTTRWAGLFRIAGCLKSLKARIRGAVLSPKARIQCRIPGALPPGGRLEARRWAARRGKDSCFWRFQCLFQFTPSAAGDNLGGQRHAHRAFGDLKGKESASGLLKPRRPVHTR